VRRSAVSGLYLLDEMEGFDRVVVVEAVRTGTHPPGAVLSFPLEDLHAPEGPSPHSIGLPRRSPPRGRRGRRCRR
jgi:hydrogenase maturation protease